jgi:hypothetical protein
VLASLSDANPLATASEYTVTVDWGDGSSDTVRGSGGAALSIVPSSGGAFQISGSHTYAIGPASYTITVTIQDDGGARATTTLSAVPAQATGYLVLAPSAVAPGAAFSFSVSALDATGHINTNYTGTAHFTTSDSSGLVPPDYTFVAADHGTHTFTATLNTLGGQSITATDTKDPAITGTAPVTVSGAVQQVTHFMLGIPAIVTAGVPFSFSVIALDAQNHDVPTYFGMVHFSTTNPSAQLPPDQNLVGGLGAFQATLNTVGNGWTITVNDVLDPGITGTAVLVVALVP